MKSVLITGAYGGMGRAAARHLRDRGWRIFALDRRVEAGEENIIPLQADITDADSIKSAYASVMAQAERLDAILHFAGIYMLDSMVEMTEEDFRRIFAVNVQGAFLVNHTFLPLLGEGSRILMTTSELATLDPLPFTGVYAVTKGALDRYAYSLRMELQLLGIGVSVLRAGAVGTDMLGVSTTALDRFCEKTKLYSCNAQRFRQIVGRVEARHISPEKIARKCEKILTRRSPAFAYSINRNPLLCLLNILPARMQFWIIRMILR